MSPFSPTHTTAQHIKRGWHRSKREWRRSFPYSLNRELPLSFLLCSALIKAGGTVTIPKWPWSTFETHWHQCHGEKGHAFYPPKELVKGSHWLHKQPTRPCLLTQDSFVLPSKSINDTLWAQPSCSSRLWAFVNGKYLFWSSKTLVVEIEAVLMGEKKDRERR